MPSDLRDCGHVGLSNNFALGARHPCYGLPLAALFLPSARRRMHPLQRLNDNNQSQVPHSVGRGCYPRDVAPKIVHLGVGAFHRAHQAWYFHQLNKLQADAPWMIVGASLRSPTASDQLNPQQGWYSHHAQSATDVSHELVGSIHSVIDARSEPRRLRDLIAAPSTQLVTLTITEKGYCYDPATGELAKSDAAVQADLASLEHPVTALGHLLAGLMQRYRAGHKGVTVLSCDNLSHNGNITKRMVLTLAQHHDPALAHWIDTHVAFPNAMVDRIAPAMSSAKFDEVTAILGFRDDGAVVTEAFSQWVIEDTFAAERPALEKVGVTWVADVAPWEQRKLRLLNAAHSGLACLGSWFGLEHVHEAVSGELLGGLCDALWREILPTLPIDNDFDAEAYCRALKQRFANPHLQHALLQIATDSSQKLPQRILAPLSERLERGEQVSTLTHVVAAWMCIQGGVSQSDQPLRFTDPLQPALARQLEAAPHCYQARASLIIEAYPPLQGLVTRFPAWRNELEYCYRSLHSRSDLSIGDSSS